MKNERLTGIRVRKTGRLLRRNRTDYSRLLRVESLETRSLMAADFMGVSDLFATSNPVAAEGEGPAPILGFIPLPPVGPAGSGGPALGSGAEFLPAASTFFLHSRPTAKKTIYLDFDGFTARGTSWNTTYNIASIVSPAWDPARNGAAFTPGELDEIQATWQRVAADFAPFDVDVTTEDPGEANLVNTGGTDDRWGIRNVITLTNFSGQNVGGFAYIGSFNWNYERVGASDTPAYIFNGTSRDVAAAVSHETGHSIGLSHDGTTAANPVQPSQEYYDGHGTGENGWGPIMGSGYYRNVTTWDNGTYIGSSNGAANSNYGKGPSDLQVITQNNGFGFIPDSDGNSETLATTLVGTTIPGGKQTLSKLGTIEQPGDLDYFKFQTGTGVVDLFIDPYVSELFTSNGAGGYTRSVEASFLNGQAWDRNQGSNLDVEATLYDGAGNVLAVSNPAGLRASFTNLSLSVGTYYIRVDGVGFGNPTGTSPTGYSEYGSLGHYLISGTIASSIEIAISDVSSYVENAAPVRVASNASFSTFNINTFNGGSLQFSLAANFQTGDQLGLLSSGTGPGQISVAGSDVSFGGVLIGTLSAGSQSRAVTFNSAASSAAVEAVIRAITFEHTTDGPTATQRQVSVFLDNANNGASNRAFALVGVIPTNDSPILSAVRLMDVEEDSLNPPGSKLSTLLATAFRDVDLGSSLSGVAVTSNTAASTTGVWEYSENGSQWASIGTVSSISSLALSRDAWIRFRPALNFNGSPTPLQLRAMDEMFAGAFSTLVVRATIDTTTAVAGGPVSLTDSPLTTQISPVNDTPVALVTQPTIESNEDAFFAFVIPTSSWFKDADEIDASVLRLSLSQSNGQIIPNWLTFDSTSGNLSGLPTNDQVGNYEFVVKASDSFNAFATVTFTLSILNVNDTPTAINLVGDSVAENARGVLIGTLFATDPDGIDSIVYSLPNADPDFAIVGNQLFVASGRSFDYEQDATIDLTIRASDSGSPPLFLDKIIQIKVQDINEFSPGFRPVTFRVPENTPVLASVGTLFATDGDTADRVRYRFAGPAPTNFALDPDTGRVSLNAGATLDFEGTDSYQFFVEAYDNGLPQLATSSSVNVIVEDVNEFAPTISTSSISVSERQQSNVAFSTVQASDGDVRQRLAFSLRATETRFSINPTTGALSLTRNGIFDFEQSSVSTLFVSVADTGGLFEEKSIIVNITDANDAPTSASVASLSLLANVSSLDLGTITIFDQDVGQEYRIQSLDDRFLIENGRLVLAPNRAVNDSDPVAMFIPIIATEVGSSPTTYQLSINITRIPNALPWQNRINALNVDRSKLEQGQLVNPLDALVIINAINGNQSGRLPNPRPASTLDQGDLDADGDGSLSPLDVLVIVNFLNNQASGEGESGMWVGANDAAPLLDPTMEKNDDASQLWLTAYQQLEEERQLVRRRRS